MPLAVSLTYESLHHAGRILNEKNDCAVIAVSAIASQPYDTIHTLFRHYGRRPRCGTQMYITRQVLQHLNLSTHDITKFYSPSSVRSLAPQLPLQGRFLIVTRSHIVAHVDGVTHDWSAMRKLYTRSILQVEVQGEEMPFPTPPSPAQSQLLPTNLIDLSKPTQAVHQIADMLYARKESSPPSTKSSTESRRWWSTFRAKVVAECITHGIHPTTASVQVGKWIRDL